MFNLCFDTYFTNIDLLEHLLRDQIGGVYQILVENYWLANAKFIALNF